MNTEQNEQMVNENVGDVGAEAFAGAVIGAIFVGCVYVAAKGGYKLGNAAVNAAWRFSTRKERAAVRRKKEEEKEKRRQAYNEAVKHEWEDPYTSSEDVVYVRKEKGNE